MDGHHPSLRAIGGRQKAATGTVRLGKLGYEEFLVKAMLELAASKIQRAACRIMIASDWFRQQSKGENIERNKKTEICVLAGWTKKGLQANNGNGLGKEEKNPGVKGEGLREALEGLHEDGQESFQQ
jgi:hypothetical protein